MKCQYHAFTLKSVFANQLQGLQLTPQIDTCRLSVLVLFLAMGSNFASFFLDFFFFPNVHKNVFFSVQVEMAQKRGVGNGDVNPPHGKKNTCTSREEHENHWLKAVI